MKTKNVYDIINDLKLLEKEFTKIKKNGYLYKIEDNNLVEELNKKIDKFEDVYITKQNTFHPNKKFEFINPLEKDGKYYGIGSLSYHSEEISLDYCIEVFKDVYEEIKFQIKNFSKFIEDEEKNINDRKKDVFILNFNTNVKSESINLYNNSITTNDKKLDDRIKIYEKKSEYVIPSNEHIIVRIDGHKFSKFTKGLKRPFDYIFRKAMELTTIDLVKEYGAYTGYTQSDEITLLLPSLEDNSIEIFDGKTGVKSTDKRIKKGWKHLFNGRSQKIVSLIAAFTTISFNKHLNNLVNEMENVLISNEVINNNDKKYIEIWRKKINTAYFDARVFGVPSEEEVLNSFLFRTRDAEKNSKAGFAQTYCSHKELQNKNSKEQIDFTLSKKGKDWNSIEDKYKYGVFIKKELYLKSISNNSDKKQSKNIIVVEGKEFVQRSRFVSYSEKLYFSDENIKKIMSKYIN